MPMPARWRVPICVDRTGFMESGRKQAAAAMGGDIQFRNTPSEKNSKKRFQNPVDGVSVLAVLVKRFRIMITK